MNSYTYIDLNGVLPQLDPTHLLSDLMERQYPMVGPVMTFDIIGTVASDGRKIERRARCRPDGEGHAKAVVSAIRRLLASIEP